MKNVWVITDSAASYAELCSGAKTLGESVTLVYAGDKSAAVGADKAIYLGEISDTVRFTSYMRTIVSLVKEAAPELVMLGVTKNCRLAAGKLAAALGTSVISDASNLKASEDGVSAERMVYGGAAISRVRALGATAVVCVANGAYEATCTAPVADITEAEIVPACGCVKCVGVKAGEPAGVNLAAAKRIVAVGRGVADETVLESAKSLAGAMGAELGCTRPIAEEMKWLPRASYIGISGVIVKPDVYLSIGVSGQIQHTVGMSDSGVIIAINKDENAPIFKTCDYGIVGNLEKIVPALTALIGK